MRAEDGDVTDQASRGVGIERRELVRRILLAGAGATAAQALIASSSSAESTPAALSDECKKVLVERLCNTRYSIDEEGDLVVRFNDGVWPGFPTSGAQHHDWLFNPMHGLKANPTRALQTDLSDPGIPDHLGADPGDAARAISEIFARAAELGVMDSANLVYFVLKAKMDADFQGAKQKGLQDFVDWVDVQDVNDSLKGQLANLVRGFEARPQPMDHHVDW